MAQVKPPEEGKEEIKVVVVRREAKRRLLVEGIDPFAPKRRSSRVRFVCYTLCGHCVIEDLVCGSW